MPAKKTPPDESAPTPPPEDEPANAVEEAPTSPPDDELEPPTLDDIAARVRAVGWNPLSVLGAAVVKQFAELADGVLIVLEGKKGRKQ